MVSAALAVMLSLSKHGAAATAAAATASPPSAARTISIVNFAFVPATITVAPGTVVTFVNDDSEPHTATSAAVFDSGGLDTGDRWSRTFAKAGTYNYFCALHPMMRGVVIVKGPHA